MATTVLRAFPSHCFFFSTCFNWFISSLACFFFFAYFNWFVSSLASFFFFFLELDVAKKGKRPRLNLVPTLSTSV
jgi:hypothetical protein